MFYLLRLEPFASLHKELQGGRFDFADRLFSSVAATWSNCLKNSSDVKELTPEWYGRRCCNLCAPMRAIVRTCDPAGNLDGQLPPTSHRGSLAGSTSPSSWSTETATTLASGRAAAG